MLNYCWSCKRSLGCHPVCLCFYIYQVREEAINFCSKLFIGYRRGGQMKPPSRLGTWLDLPKLWFRTKASHKHLKREKTRRLLKIQFIHLHVCILSGAIFFNAEIYSFYPFYELPFSKMIFFPIKRMNLCENSVKVLIGLVGVEFGVKGVSHFSASAIGLQTCRSQNAVAREPQVRRPCL